MHQVGNWCMVHSLVTGVLLVVLDCMYTMYTSSDINGIESVVGKTE